MGTHLVLRSIDEEKLIAAADAVWTMLEREGFKEHASESEAAGPGSGLSVMVKPCYADKLSAWDQVSCYCERGLNPDF